QSQLEQVSQLASDLATAQQALVDATDASQGVQKEHDQAKAAADVLARQAKQAQTRAASSAAFATALIRAEGSRALQMDPLTAALSSSGNLLQKLSAVDRLRTATSHRQAAIAEAAAAAHEARKLRDEARAASAQAAAIDVDASVQAVADAQSQVDAAAAALSSIPTVQTSGTGFRSLIDTPVGTTTGWVLPVHGPMTDGFGPRPSRPLGTALFHPGDDLAAACGTPIIAASAGTVVAAGPNSGYGNFVMIDHGGGVKTAYGHIVDGGIRVAVGQTVAAGQLIALVGSTGLSTGCHLHFEVRVNGVQIDPLPFMAARGVTLGTR
ncbi:MAG TPA: peptidoglycan DD-metalloendopeptidase family protein, partial [Leifsonia sp.]